MMTIEFKDEDDTYGRIETEENPDKIELLLDQFKKSEPEEYNIDDFYDYLKNKEIDFTILNVEADRIIHF